MRALCNREGLLQAFSMVSTVVPARSPKPILQNVHLRAGPEGSELSATDLEVGLVYRVLGVKADLAGAILLPTQKMQSILRATPDEEISLEVAEETLGRVLTIRSLHARFSIPTEDPALFPAVPTFPDGDAYWAIAPADLKRAIARTIHATDVESTRYALGGVLFEPHDDEVVFVGTDGRRLARQVAPADVEGVPVARGNPVVPAKALKILDRLLSPADPPVHVAFLIAAGDDKAVAAPSSVCFRTERATLYSRLVEGRFPKYQDVFPASKGVTIAFEAGPLRGALEQASITTSEESRGIDCTFEPGNLKLASRTADVGSSDVDLPLAGYDGSPIPITFDPRYVTDMLKVLDPAATVRVDLIDDKHAAVFRTDDGLSYVVMPLTKER